MNLASKSLVTGQKKKIKIGNNKLESIYQIMEKINSSHDLNIVGRDILYMMIKALDCVGGSITLVDHEQRVLRPFIYSQIKVFIEKIIPLLSKPFDEHLISFDETKNYTVRTVLEKKIISSNQFEKFMISIVSKLTSKIIQRVAGMKTVASSPIIVGNKVMGVLMVGFREKKLSQEKKRLLKFVSDQCAVAINNAQKYNKLQHQYKQLQELNAQQSNFISTSAHELRTPLSTALFQAQDLVESLGEVECLKKKVEAALVVKSLKKLQNVTEKIFAVQMYDAKKVKLQLDSIHMNRFLKKINKKFKPLMKQRSIEWDIKNKLPRALTFTFDPFEIEKMITELLNNAAKFTPKNGRVSLVAELEDKNIRLKVVNSGNSIPKGERVNIFKKFKGNHSKQSMGIGLGLYIAKKIADLHQATIWVDETLEENGATFCVLLPYFHKASKDRISYLPN